MKHAPLILLVLLTPVSAHAQVAVRAFADAGFTMFTATQSFKAVVGTPSGFVYGGGLEISDSRYFVAISAQRFSHKGHRVFVFQDQVFPLNVRNTVSVTPLDLTAGYRLRFRRVVPYIGGGIGWYRYQERSDPAIAAEDIQQTSTGYHVLAGAEVPVHRWLGVGLDAQWATVPNALGRSNAGVSQVYDEHDLGGFTVRTRIVVGR
jgi:opacity protein-like surface antigen